MMIETLYTNVIGKRDKIQIYADIIRVTIKPTQITRILRYANVKHSTFVEYIDTLHKAGLVEIIDMKNYRSKSKKSRVKYKATEKGLRWCKVVDFVYEMVVDDEFENGQYVTPQIHYEY